MVKYEFFFLTIITILTIIVQQSTALKCWRCSSDTQNSAFCADPFDSSIIDEKQRNWHYITCTPQTQQTNQYPVIDQVAACKKVKQYVNDKLVVIRSCSTQSVHADRDASCLNNTVGLSYIKVESCQTCQIDGCNGAAQYGPIFILIAAPVILLKWIIS